MPGPAGWVTDLVSDVTEVTLTCLSLGIVVLEYALVGGVNGLVGRVLEGTMFESIVVLFAVEGEGEVEVAYFGHISICRNEKWLSVPTVFCLGDWKR
jgi:hypothetical protein